MYHIDKQAQSRCNNDMYVMSLHSKIQGAKIETFSLSNTFFENLFYAVFKIYLFLENF